MTSDSAGVAQRTSAGVLHLTLNRPEKKNALDDAMVRRLIDALETANNDPDVRAILLDSSGDDFCVGADIIDRNRDSGSSERPRVGSIQRRVTALAHRLLPMVLDVQVPIVCAVRGWAVGIGLHLAVAADFTIVAEDATLWEPFLTRGFTPDSGGTWLLPRAVGPVRARELIMLGRKLDGRTAAEWGLVHEAVPAADVDTRAGELVSELAAGPTVALGLAKMLLAGSSVTPLRDQLANEAFALELSSRTSDFREGLQAFAERRRPDYQGR